MGGFYRGAQSLTCFAISVMNQKVDFKKILFADSSILLAATTILAYYSAFQYKVGYFRVFGVPNDLISVDIGTLVSFGVTILCMLPIFYYFVSSILISRIHTLTKMPWRQLVLSSIVFFIFLLIIFLYFYNFDWRNASIISSAYLLCYLSFYFSEPPLKWLCAAILCTGLITSFSQGLGQWHAKTQSKYTVITSLKNTFVICKTGDYFLCSTYDINSHTFAKSFRLLPIKDDGLDLEYRDIGPLHP